MRPLLTCLFTCFMSMAVPALASEEPVPEAQVPVEISGDQALVNAEGYLNNIISLVQQARFSEVAPEIDNMQSMLDWIRKGAKSEGERRIRLEGNLKQLSNRLEKMKAAAALSDTAACRYEIKRANELMTMVRIFIR